jgi:hypothetical protein
MTHRRLSAFAWAEAQKPLESRRIAWLQLARAAYWDRSAALAFALSGLGVVAIVYAIVVPMPAVLRPLSIGAAVLLTAWFLVLPMLNARHFAAIARRGVMLSAHVASVRYLDPRETPGRSLAEMHNGRAAGELAIEGSGAHPTFESEEPWARDLHPGTAVTAVIDREDGSVMLLALSEEAP